MCEFCDEKVITEPEQTLDEKELGCLFRLVKIKDSFAIEFSTDEHNLPCFAETHFCPQCGRKL